jgi:tripartite ATP-independent transporter DctP family solute receptor
MRKQYSRLMILCVVMALVLVASVQVVAASKITIRLGHGQPTTDVIHLSCLKFKEYLERETNGAVQVVVYPSSQLGSIRDMVEGLRLGTIQAVWDGPARLAVYTELADVFKVPYLLRDREHGEKAWDSEIGKKLFQDIAAESGIEIVTIAWRGARHITSTKPIYDAGDLKGLKIRVPPYAITTESWKALGASPTPMDMNEVYLALQQRVIEAQENAIMTCTSNRLYEVVDYLVLSAHNMDFGCLLMGADYLRDLPQDIQDAIYKAAADAAQFHGDYVDAEEWQALELWRQEGVTIIEPDIDSFRKVLEQQDFVNTYCANMSEYIVAIQNIQ